ncbi:hypothetical protein C8K18_101544 [Paraburkholderia sp. GV068]|nr:hypothetical protein C8K19_101469 [Paraburkholderia sp. GV072]PUB09028.1 hypothetical protein C8K18_101544 [Paraburkholderia sp. GV068]
MSCAAGWRVDPQPDCSGRMRELLLSEECMSFAARASAA